MAFDRPAALVVPAMLTTLLMAATSSDEAPGWPQYRGVHRDGVTPAQVSWPEGGPRVAWRHPIGDGFSQIAVRGNAVFTGTSDEENEHLVRFNAASGKEAWRKPVGGTTVFEFGSGPRSTPTLNGDRVYFLGSKGNLVALEASNGNPVWSVDVTERFGASPPRYGYSGSPLVVDDLLIVEVGGKEESSLVALDKLTGETKWSTLSRPAGYGSPILMETGSVRQVVLVRMKTLTSLDLGGKVLWTHELEEGAVAMPIHVGNGRIFVSASGDTGCVMLRVKKSDEGFQVEEVWKNRNMRNHFNTSVVRDGYIYGFDNATLKCLSVKTGELMWAKRGLGKGSLIVAGGRLVVLSDKGKIVLLDATPEGYLEEGSFQALEGRSWTAPSLAGGRVYLRNLTEITRLDFGG